MFFFNYANFNGRSTRAEYWWAYLFIFIVNFGIGFLCGLLNLGETASGIFTGIWSLAILVPSLAISWRRLHDVDKAGGWFFINLIPIIGNIYYLFLTVQPSGPDNRFGPDPYGEE
ncbi:MAG: DUF805 domain-containing protein [Muribaculaceae bacterium]|nr:DUF805 domain-containing protein [Muribaculaceae bacterium]